MSYTLKLPNRFEPIEFLSLGELAMACGRSKDTLKKMIHKGQIPEANFRTPETTVHKGKDIGKKVRGHRLYSKELLVPRLIAVFSEISQGKKITEKQRMEILNAFNDERLELTKTQEA